jgi:uncharacterized protein YwgA
MNEEYVSVYLVHNHVMNRPPSTDSLNDRIIAQKVIYLANALGVNCGDYIFNWYKKGPYSPALTRVLYDNNNLDKKVISEYTLRKEAENSLNLLKNLMSMRPDELTEDSWVELLASVHYLKEHKGSKQIVINDLLRLKPKYNSNQVKYALEKLEKNGILN